MHYHFAPPLWVKPDKITGAPVKRTYGAWMRAPLARPREAQGRCAARWLDVFGYTEERRLERRLVTDYERTIAAIERELTRREPGTAVEIANVPSSIRGYGHVKRRNIEAARSREQALLAQFRKASQEKAVALAA